MTDHHFDRIARVLSGSRSRRQALAALMFSVFGRSLATGSVVAGPGCKDVGKRCTSKADCCSGICSRKHGRKRCRAHDTGGCKPGHSGAICANHDDIPCTTSSGLSGACFTTTGNAGYCGNSANCMTCTRDDECRTFWNDDRAACARCLNCGSQTQTVCLSPG
jgi:hypothetical protein